MTFDIAIIGAGPGGYVAAIRASQLGAKVALIEKEHVGGTCLNRGCVPSKAVITSAQKFASLKKLDKFGISAENFSYDYSKIFERKETIVSKLRKGLEGVIKSNEVAVFKGEAVINDKNSLYVDDELITFKNLIIATGSECASLPNLRVDNEFIFDTNGILALKSIPENILVVGSGASGIEWSRIFKSLDKNVSLIEIAPKLMPNFDFSIQDRVERLFKINKIKAFAGTSIVKIENRKVYLSNEQVLEVDMIMLAAGRKPNSSINGIEKLGIEIDRGFVKIDDNMKTNQSNIYAIGDVTGKLQLAHVASHQAISAVEHIILGKNSVIDYALVPKIVYGYPEFASVGITEDEAIKLKLDYKTSTFPISALGKAFADDELEGFIKIIAVKDKIAGAHIVANNASDLIHTISVGMKFVCIEQFKESVFAHPTYSEGIYEAILGLDNEFLNLPKVVQNERK